MNKVALITMLIMTCQVTLAQPVAESSPKKLKILSWNIFMLPGVIAYLNGRRAEAIGHQIAASDYDVVVFQEAFCPVARRKIRRLLDERFPYHAGPANQKLISFKTNSGLWIFSQYPIVNTQSIIFKNRHGTDALSRKGALLVELDVDGKSIQVAATHLQNSGDTWRRHAQCVEFYERLIRPNQKAGTPQIICGDFNIDRTSEESYRFMLTTLGATDGELSSDYSYSYDRVNNDLQVEGGKGQDLIDYILIRENGGVVQHAQRQIRVIKQRWHRLHEDLSDHYSIEAMIYFSNFPAMISAR